MNTSHQPEKEQMCSELQGLLQHFDSIYSNQDLDSIKPDEIYHFQEEMTKTLSNSISKSRVKSRRQGRGDVGVR